MQLGASMAPDTASNKPGPGSLWQVQPGQVRVTGTSYGIQLWGSIQESIPRSHLPKITGPGPGPTQEAGPEAGLKTSTPTV